MKQLWSSFVISFSMYSKIPMPKINWTKENMRCVMCFFPVIGAVIGGICYLWGSYGRLLPIGEVFHTVILLLIPVVITGGIHLDGLLDTADALSSYQDKERKLEILKDSNAGAFAVIIAVSYFLLYYGVFTELTEKGLPVVCLGFILSRALSGFAIAAFPMAKNTGLAAAFSNGAKKHTVRLVTGMTACLTGLGMCLIQPVLGISGIAGAMLTFGYYYQMSKKQFGGITGDLAGFFLQICELVIALFVAAGEICMRSLL